MTSRYHEVYESWRRDPQGFWAGVASSEIDWSKPWDKVFDEKSRGLRPLVPGRGVQHLLQLRGPSRGETARRASDHL